MPLFIPPLVAVTLGAVGAVTLAPVVVRAAIRHARRVNERLDALRAAARANRAEAAKTGAADTDGAESSGPVRRLRRDPKTGDYSPE